MKTPVLDHGYVELIEAWGGGVGAEYNHTPPDYEVGIIEAARQSTQGSFRGWEQDAKLLKFLYENNHQTPFEFAGLVIEVQAPIFVFREWHRHRTQSYNEMSARYAPLPDLNYLPSIERLMMNSSGNKQAGAIAGAGEFTEEVADRFQKILASDYRDAEDSYQTALMNGVPKELARLILPVGRYSKMRASTSLRNWLGFMTLRCDEKAQWEIRQYAWAVARIIEQVFPQTFKLWDEGRL